MTGDISSHDSADDDLLSPAELAALIAPLRITTTTKPHSWDAMSADQWALKMQGRDRPITELGTGEKPLRGRNRDYIPVSTIGDISQSLSSGAARQQRVRNKRRQRGPSPLDPVARPLLIEARAYSRSLRSA